jgi:hypothetical protein
MKGLLIDGPAAGMAVEVGEPPLRRAIVIPDGGGFAENAYRYYLRSIDSAGSSYMFGGEVLWPPEARSEVIARTDRRDHVADDAAPGALLNGN